MSLPAKIAALLASLTPNQVSALHPAVKQQLANECARVLALASTTPREIVKPRSGLLADLADKSKGRE